jgi:CRP-like cAMP-binding protein
MNIAGTFMARGDRETRPCSRLSPVWSCRMPTDHPLLTRLRRALDLSQAEASAIGQVAFQSVTVPADQAISREGDRPSRSCLIAEGLACTAKVVASGTRQIMAFHLKGDMPDLHSLHLKLLDSDIWALTACRLAYFPHADLRQLCHAQPRVADELWRVTLVDASIYREWMVNIAQRQAASRLAHLFCEMMLRSREAGLAEQGDTCPLPVTQADLGEATGRSVVHINRTLQDLRAQGLIGFGQGRLTIHDWKALVELGDFRMDYLHLQEPASMFS